MNVVDSSGWLEYFAGGPNAEVFAEPLLVTEELVVPVVSLYEVFKKVRSQRGDGSGLEAVALMRQGRLVNLDDSLALLAAVLSADFELPMADAMILATARLHEATLWTQDRDFEGIEGVRYFPKTRD